MGRALGWVVLLACVVGASAGAVAPTGTGGDLDWTVERMLLALDADALRLGAAPVILAEAASGRIGGMAERADPRHTDTHRHERPEDWGWHASFGKWARIAGWLAVIVMVLQNVTTYYNTAHAPWLFGVTAILVFLLVRDHFRRKNAWRN